MCKSEFLLLKNAIGPTLKTEINLISLVNTGLLFHGALQCLYHMDPSLLPDLINIFLNIRIPCSDFWVSRTAQNMLLASLRHIDFVGVNIREVLTGAAAAGPAVCPSLLRGQNTTANTLFWPHLPFDASPLLDVHDLRSSVLLSSDNNAGSPGLAFTAQKPQMKHEPQPKISLEEISFDWRQSQSRNRTRDLLSSLVCKAMPLQSKYIKKT